MIDLTATSGLPLTLHEDDPHLGVWLPDGLQPGRLLVRKLAELRRSLEDPNAEGPGPAYWMYNGVAYFSAADTRGVYNWRYDLTVLPPGRYGEEYARTAGHYHALIEGTEPSWPEVYEVLHGEALFILQKAADPTAGPQDARIEDVILMRAGSGSKAMLPPNCGHWTVNVTGEPLVICNWISADFSSYYESVEQAHGPCCYVKVGPDGPLYQRNRGYAHPPAHLRHARPVEAPELGLRADQPIFRALHERPEQWRYLCNPSAAPVDLFRAIEIIRTDPFPA